MKPPHLLSRRRFLRNAAGLLIPAAGLLLPGPRAIAQVFHGPAHHPAAGGGTTWNSADKSASITLSNGDLTATGSGSGASGVRATTGKASGKWYWRIVLDDLVGGDPSVCGPGILSSGATLDDYYSTTYSALLHGLGTITIAGFSARVNNTYVGDGPFATATNGDIADIAADFDADLVWFRKNGAGNWNDGGGTPDAGTGGYAITGSQTYYPYVHLRSTIAVTARFADDSSGTAPSGFSWLG